MSYNGSGTFQINSTGQPVVGGTIISSSTFNALTADLATGLTTAITKDGQTATTARIPFALGINSTLVTDASSTTTGSIITAGGVGIAKALYVGGALNYGGVTLTNAVTGTGKMVLDTAPTIASANLTTALTLAGAAGTNGQVLTSAGSGLPSWTTPAGGLAAATQAQMEAATSNAVAATPLNTNFHPGVAKAWLRCGTTGNILASHNISSITDSGVGDVTVTIDTDFSSANYVVCMSVTAGSSRFIFTSSVSAGSFNASSVNSTLSSTDPDSWHFSCFGDQA